MSVSVRLYRDETGGKRETWQQVDEWNQSYVILRAFSQAVERTNDDHNGCYMLMAREELINAATELAGLALWEDPDYREYLLNVAQELQREVESNPGLDFWLFEWDN